MFYRDCGGLRPVDLCGIYEGQAAFIVGSAPSLNDENTDLLALPGIYTICVNSASTIIPFPTFMVGLDDPDTFPTTVLQNGSIAKIGSLAHLNKTVLGRAWKEYPNTYFIGMTERKKSTTDFFYPGPDFNRTGNSLLVAIQLACVLGFRTIYLLGVSLKVNPDKPYFNDLELSKAQVEKNIRAYNRLKANLEELREQADEAGIKIFNVTRDSALKCYEYIAFEDAVERERIK